MFVATDGLGCEGCLAVTQGGAPTLGHTESEEANAFPVCGFEQLTPLATLATATGASAEEGAYALMASRLDAFAPASKARTHSLICRREEATRWSSTSSS